MWNLLPFSIKEKLEAPYRREARIAIKEVLSKLNGRKVSVLDAGAGEGFAKKFFANCEYTSIDFKKNAFFDIDVIGDIQKMPFQSESFDIVASFEVLEYVPEAQKAIAEFFRVLRQGGLLILSAPLMVGFHNDLHRYTLPALKNLIENTGFKVEKIIPVGGYYRMLGWQISKISYLIKKPKNKFFWLFYYLIKIPVGLIFQIIIPLVLFHLDWLDKDKKETCGYLVVALKLKK